MTVRARTFVYAGKTKNKFGAYRTICASGHTHPSKLEAKRCDELHVLLKAGQIRNLTIQPKYPLIVQGVKVATYIGDFLYFEGNRGVLEDTKSKATATDPYYRLKKRLLNALYPGVEIVEVYK